MILKRFVLLTALSAVLLLPSLTHAKLDYFTIRPITSAEFYKFIKVFSKMRGPIRSAILKDRSTNFENADPYRYVAGVKDEKAVKKILKKNSLSWSGFNELMGNILLGYFSIQPGKTKAALIRQLSDYGLMMSNDQIPAEYRQVIQEVIKTEEGAALAGMALEFVLQIPPENIELARKNSRQLDQLFYTRFWKGKLE